MGLEEIKRVDRVATVDRSIEPEAAPKPDQINKDVLELTVDEETHTVSFDLQVAVMPEGDKTYTVVTKRVTMREPFPRDFFLMESWMRKADDDYRDLQIALVKLASLCIVDYDGKPSVSFAELFNALYDLDSSRRLVKALDYFPGRIASYIEHLRNAAKSAGIQLPE